ncbi:hypothetical protein EI613_02810 [Azospirillum sp. 412522]|nr:hypothetical protein [Azospirillum sp. 412522]
MRRSGGKKRASARFISRPFVRRKNDWLRKRWTRHPEPEQSHPATVILHRKTSHPRGGGDPGCRSKCLRRLDSRLRVCEEIGYSRREASSLKRIASHRIACLPRPSFPRRRESRLCKQNQWVAWIPASAGMTSGKPARLQN